MRSDAPATEDTGTQQGGQRARRDVDQDSDDGASLRRQLLGGMGAMGAVALAGCGGTPIPVLDFQAVDHPELADRAAVDDHDRDGLVDAMAEFDSVVSTESAPPLEDGDLVKLSSRRYAVLSVEDADDRLTELGVGFERLSDGAGQDDDGPIQADELPAVDRAVVVDAFPAMEEAEFGEVGTVTTVGTRVQNDEESAGSVLDGADGRVLQRVGEQYRIHTRRRTVATHRTTVGAARRFERASAAGEWLAREQSVELAGLPESERAVVRDAIDGKCKRDGADSDAFDAVVDSIRRSSDFEGEDSSPSDEQKWIVQWQDQTYWVHYSRDGVPSGIF